MPTSPRGRSPVILPLVLLIAAMFSVQFGAVLATTLFPVVGAAGAATLRLVFAAAMLLAFWRPWRIRPSRREARTIVVYGVAMGLMNLFFYSALRTVPLGIVVALEFTGPLAVAMAASRRALHFLWIALAAAGPLLLLPAPAGGAPLDPRGIACALGAAACWALYIVFGRRAGAAHGGQTTALGMLVGALAILPLGIAQAGGRMLLPVLLPAAIGVALLSSALPYSLEMFALTRLPTRTFGVLMSLEPALGALAGLIFLGEQLTPLQWAAIASIMLASGGSAATASASAAE